MTATKNTNPAGNPNIRIGTPIVPKRPSADVVRKQDPPTRREFLRDLDKVTQRRDDPPVS